MYESLNLTQWIVTAIAAFTLGVSKAGLKGIAIIIITVMALVFGSRASTGIVMPLLIFGDIFAIIYYRRHVHWKYLTKLLPWILFGVLIGVYAGKDIPEAYFKKGMSVIILISVFLLVWMDRGKKHRIPHKTWFGATLGLSAGFATMIGNLAGAFSNIYFLAMKLPKNVFIGTAAWLFFFVNLFKLPFHIWVWRTITMDSFMINMSLFPFMIVGLLVGVKIVALIRDFNYRRLILLLTGIGAVIIFFR